MDAEKTPLEPQLPAKKKARRLTTWDKLPTVEVEEFDRAVDWEARSDRGSGLLRWLERLALAVERPVNRLVGAPQLNPFYHTDTIALFFLVVVGLTGVYVLLLYQFGYEASYESVAKVEGYLIGRVIRVLHRYAASGLVTATLLHAVRTFFMDRFRGPRWLAWVSGVGMTAVTWLAGVTGYWLIWDERAQAITQGFVNLLKPFPSLAAAFYTTFLGEAGEENGWILMFAVFVAHLGLSALIGLFFWYHVKRLERPRLLPPQYWMIGLGVLSVIVALIFPADMLPMADFSRQPGSAPLDLFYLFYLPLALKASPSGLWIGVAGLIALIGLLAAVPWVFPRQKKPSVAIDPDLCVGCKMCAEDCPYGALKMADRDDGGPYKQIAVADQNLCVSCGICVGSCATLAVSLGRRSPKLLWEDVSARLKLARAGERAVRVVFACERHIAHGARPFLRTSAEDAALAVDGVAIEVIPVICAAMLHPGLLTRTLEAGAAAVQVVGCPPNDCANREGNLWLEERLTRERAPRLKSAYSDAPIFTAWLPPDQFAQVLSLHASPASGRTEVRQTLGSMFPALGWRNFLAAFALLAVVLLLQVWLTRVPYAPYAEAQAWVQVVGQINQEANPTRLVLEVDDQRILSSEHSTDKSGAVFEQIPILPGTHHLRLFFASDDQEITQVLFDKTVTLDTRQVFELTFRGTRR